MEFAERLLRNMLESGCQECNSMIIQSRKNLVKSQSEKYQADPEPAQRYLKYLKKNNFLELFETDEPMPVSER